MVEPKRTCPECHLIFAATPPETGLLTCPLCNTAFAAYPSVETMPSVPALSATSVASAQQVWKGCLAVAALLFLAGGLVYAYRLLGGIEPRTAHSTPAPLVTPPAAEPSPILEIDAIRPPPPPRPSARPPLPYRLSTALKPPPLVEEPRAPLTLPERVNRAIDRGVTYLRKNHNGHNQYRKYLGLLGLTLLECGIPANDPSVQQLAAWLRSREADLTATYELSLAILFLDRLGDPSDRTLIRTCGQRLLAGQQECGAWTYACAMNDYRRASDNLPTTVVTPEGPQIISWKKSVPPRKRAARRPMFRGDNSNTQFAILGLWVAQRHGVPSRRALLAAEQYFRQTQAADGSWSYHPLHPHYRDSMTCAGLMSLAMRYGFLNGQGRDMRPERAVQVNDRAVEQGLRFLDRSLGKVALTGGRITGVEARDPLYFLYSLERMAVIYDLKTIGSKEWYPWAAEMLVAIQQADGSWQAPYSSPVGTCFALLILKRSNVVHDLQLTVRSEKPRRDAGLGGPTILQGPAGIAGTTVGSKSAPPLGPTTTQIPKVKPSSKK